MKGKKKSGAKQARDSVFSNGDETNKNGKWIAIFILVIMVLSTLGFALSGHTGGLGGEENIPEELPLQYIEQQGQGAWFAIKNKEVFAFESIDPYVNDTESEAIANRIIGRTSLKMYVDPNYSSAESLFLFERVFKGLKISTQRLGEVTCDADTLYITHEEFNGNCIVFSTSINDSFRKTESVVYHLIK